MSATTPSRSASRPPRQSPPSEDRLSLPSLHHRHRLAGSPPALLLPNLLIPGVTHAGAAMLAADLGRHPEVCLPDTKRIGHFSPMRYGRPVDGALDAYDRHFARWSGQQYRVETGADYFDGGEPMAARISATMPGLRVVLVLRDPAHRLWTSYTDKLSRGRLPRAMSFETFVDRCLALRANGAERFEGNRYFRTLSSGFYVEFLSDWLDTFGRRARVVFTEDLQDEPGAQVGALFTWLGLDAATASPALGEDDATGGYPPSEPAAMPFNRRLWPVFPRSPGPWREPEADGTPFRRPPRQSERTRARVRSLYSVANQELAVLLNGHGYTRLPDWLSNA